MKIKKQKNKKYTILSLLILLIIVSGLICWFVITQSPSRPGVVNKRGSSRDNSRLNDISYDKPSYDEASPTLDNNTPLSQQEEKTSPQLPVTITAVNRNGDVVQVRSVIGEYIDEGICTLIMEGRSSSRIQKTAPVAPLAGTSTCQGFDIPFSELGSGEWNITLEVVSDQKSGKTERKVTL